ncbi:Capsule polysaccharide biosynthesis protein [Rhodobacteraceae bacterium THAF1]|uniref:capsular polysaccharide biosynthesis protein n=1 Tax=Palleronia sp. THAF1 TaxID=2587842 RepID=UPI000F3EFEF6|nr:capsular polysaccharide biosynthesis protein [Palleronia sp. THAF1]QFU08683.1 Capsule polysaccharide biosynthesis protein [Palleronia sp. THAF1]VDC28430.1 Capsule polysaccharide biosynthesis protein [Rhodobacteraceae bacterium THAF1]
MPALRVYTGGFLNPRLRRILTLAGWSARTGWPSGDDWIGVWGRSPYARRGEWVAHRSGAGLLRIEDAFLRSLHPGRAGEPPLGLLLDGRGVHFDSGAPSDLEHHLATAPLDHTDTLERARQLAVRLKRAHLTKYSAVDPALPVPDPGYVLVVDQTRGDASIAYSGASEAMFAEMLAFARIENPGARIVIKTHPETAQGFRAGHFSDRDLDGKTQIVDAPVSPWALLDGATAVYAVSSQLGFEAILAGHCPRIFGQPFYGGWGLTQDETPCPRRSRKLTRAQLIAGALIDYPVWYDPFRDALCEVETVIDILEAQARAWREDRHGHVASGMRLWKRRPLQKVFGSVAPLVFEDDPAKASARARDADRGLLVWAGKETPDHTGRVLRVEDGFLRSRGLGAELVPPLSLVTDDLGIYYDPTRPSRLERLIAESSTLGPLDLERARRLREGLIARGLSKYNLGSDAVPDLPSGHRILVPGQVEDDASIRMGTTEVNTNAALLAKAREDNPGAVILYKPHPDVEAGLRPGAIDGADADVVLRGIDPAALLSVVNEVWTMTSALGFEALLRGISVTTLGQPFYAGWGLTTDLGGTFPRRTTTVSLDALTYAALIAYPRYHDPVTNGPCPAEVVADRLANGTVPRPSPANRALAKAQGLLASRAHLWR